MEAKDLVKVWNAPDYSRLTPKQVSIRLPILVAAKISALCEMYPRSSKSKVIGDLLATALDEVEKELPSKKGRLVYDVPLPPPEMVIGSDVYTESERAYEDVGLKGRFRTLTEKYLRELEKEAGIKEPLEIPKPWVFEGE